MKATQPNKRRGYACIDEVVANKIDNYRERTGKTKQRIIEDFIKSALEREQENRVT